MLEKVDVGSFLQIAHHSGFDPAMKTLTICTHHADHSMYSIRYDGKIVMHGGDRNWTFEDVDDEEGPSYHPLQKPEEVHEEGLDEVGAGASGAAEDVVGDAVADEDGDGGEDEDEYEAEDDAEDGSEGDSADEMDAELWQQRLAFCRLVRDQKSMMDSGLNIIYMSKAMGYCPIWRRLFSAAHADPGMGQPRNS
jgi:hypothetical protein